MDLYRTLRVSLYLLAGTGAFAISVAERSLFYLALIAVLGALSFFTIDRGRAKPLSTEITAGLMIVLFYLTMRHLRMEEHWQAHLAPAAAHFICALQGLFFFCVLSGSGLVMCFCGSALFVVVMSGVVDSGPSLVARVACFIAVAAWTLYIHAIWRSRQDFAGKSTFLSAFDEKSSSGRAAAEPFRRLPEGAFWSTLALVMGMSAACIALGVGVFFSAPRIEGILALFERRSTGGESPNDPLLMEVGRNERSASVTGMAENVSLKNLGPIGTDSRIALTATFSKPARALAGTKNRVLLKRSCYSEYRDGAWNSEQAIETLESKNGAPIAVRDPSLAGPVFQGERTTQYVKAVALNTTSLFAAGPVVLVGARKIEVDAEGGIRSAGAPLERCTLTIAAPYDAANLPRFAAADHGEIQRYVRQIGMPPSDSEAVSKLAHQITQHSAGDPAKARDIETWLETQRRYTRNLETLRADGDPLAHFLLTHETDQARGHCGLFASAFVVLCRANDMPARLCDGFAARLDPSDAQSKSVIASNSDAHAWAEVYYKGIGWVAYDPTPATPDAGADTASAPSASKPAAAAAPGSASAPAASGDGADVSRGFVEDAWNAMLNYDYRQQRKWYEKLSGSQAAGTSGILSGRGWGGWLGAVLAWTGMAAAFGWLIQLFARRGGRRKHANASGGGRARAAVAFYNDLLQALSRRGFSRRPGQTPREFADSVLKRGGATYAPVRDVTEIFEAVRYGGGELGQEEFNRLQEALDTIREMTL